MQLLKPAFTTVPTAAEIPGLFQSALRSSGTPPFPVQDAFYTAQTILDSSMADYLAPQSQSDAIAFSSRIHAVLDKEFPIGAEMVQAGQILNSCELARMDTSIAGSLSNISGQWQFVTAGNETLHTH